MNNVVDTSRQEGVKKGIELGVLKAETRIFSSNRSVILSLLSRTIGQLPNELELQINELSLEQIESLTRIFLDFNDVNDLVDWLSDMLI